MANIGNQLSTNNFVCDTFSGTGSQTTFTPLTFAPASTASIAVFVGGSYQAPTTYTLSGTSLIFTSAPTAGTGNIRVLHLGTGSVSQVPADGSVSNVKIYATGTANSSTFLRGDNSWAVVNTNSVTGDLTVSGNTTVNGTGFLQVASGTTAQRPSSAANGQFRYNSTIKQSEIYSDGSWRQINIDGTTSTYPIEILAVAGGGGGIGESGGGGGGGGVVNWFFNATVGTTYTMTIGAGGSSGANGSDTTISGSGLTTITAKGGGYGGGSNGANGQDGGSGGGGGWNNVLGGQAQKNSNYNMGSAGGTNYGNQGRHGAGGGGAGVRGYDTTGTDNRWNGAGGDGLPFTVWSLATSAGNDGYFGGGGGGGGEFFNGTSSKTVSSLGGAGGGGNGCYGGVAGTGGSNGTANMGGGAGGQCGNSTVGLTGGSGIVIIRYRGPQRGTGGTVYADNFGYTYHKFTSTTTFTA